MPRLISKGVVVAKFPTRAQCYVKAFELKLVYDYGKRKNQLLPTTKVEGQDGDDDWQEIILENKRK